LIASVSPFIATENVSAAVPLAARNEIEQHRHAGPDGDLDRLLGAASDGDVLVGHELDRRGSRPCRSRCGRHAGLAARRRRSTNRGSAECNWSDLETVKRLSAEPNR